MRCIVLAEELNLARHRLKRGDVVDVPDGMPRLGTLVRTHQLHYYDGAEEPVAEVKPREIKISR